MATPGLRVIVLAIRNYVLHQSANQAGSLAFSWLLAMFPLLILVSASAGFFGQPGEAAALVERVLDYAPQMVRDAMHPAIELRPRALLSKTRPISLIAGMFLATLKEVADDFVRESQLVLKRPG